MIRNDRTPGLAGARNAGALASRGELIAFCDDDDEWLPDKLSSQVGTLLEHSEALVVSSGIEVLHDGRSIERLPAGDSVSLRQLCRSRRTEIHPSTVVVRREAFMKNIGMVDEAIPGSYGEDYEWLLRASRAGPILAVRKPLVRVHWHASSWFAERWQTIIDAIEYVLRTHPELRREPAGLARLYGRLAFANAALGRSREARRWAVRCLRLDWRERRAYLAFAVSLHLVRAGTIQRWANRVGRGV